MPVRLLISISAAFLLSLSAAFNTFAYDLEVNGILQGAKPRAIVNGEIVKKGGIIKEAEVTDIAANAVQFKYKNEIITLKLGEGCDLERTPYILSDKKSKKRTINDSGVTNIRLNDMTKLNFLKKSDILDLRNKYVNEYPELLTGAYKPSEAIFGQIEDGKPWWGILGISYYGPGQNSIEGPAKDSRYIFNPFLLVALSEPGAHIVNDPSLAPIPICPKPISLVWEGRSKAVATYEAGEFLRLQFKYRYPDAGKNEFDLIAYNARDFGFNYLYIDKNRSHNVPPDNNQGPVQIQQMLHCGGSCGYPGGCNNMSPYQADLRVRISSLPATLYIKLWRDKPAGTDADADMIFIIEIRD